MTANSPLDQWLRTVGFVDPKTADARNPFAFLRVEDMPVDGPLIDLPLRAKARTPENTFVLAARGSGKSALFRLWQQEWENSSQRPRIFSSIAHAQAYVEIHGGTASFVLASFDHAAYPVPGGSTASNKPFEREQASLAWLLMQASDRSFSRTYFKLIIPDECASLLSEYGLTAQTLSWGADSYRGLLCEQLAWASEGQKIELTVLCDQEAQRTLGNPDDVLISLARSPRHLSELGQRLFAIHADDGAGETLISITTWNSLLRENGRSLPKASATSRQGSQKPIPPRALTARDHASAELRVTISFSESKQAVFVTYGNRTEPLEDFYRPDQSSDGWLLQAALDADMTDNKGPRHQWRFWGDSLTEQQSLQLSKWGLKKGESIREVAARLYNSLKKVGHFYQDFTLRCSEANEKWINLYFEFGRGEPSGLYYPWEIIRRAPGESYLDRANVIRFLKREKKPEPAEPMPMRPLYVAPRPRAAQGLSDHDASVLSSDGAKVRPVRTRDVLERELLQNETPYTVLHFEGEGIFGGQCDRCEAVAAYWRLECPNCQGQSVTGRLEGFLAFQRTERDKTDEWVSAADLAELPWRESGIQLVVIRACHSATSILGAEWEGVAQSLLDQGVRAVIGMQTPVPSASPGIDRFTAALYASLRQGHTVVDSVGMARKAIAPGGFIWSSVLYLQGDDFSFLTNESRNAAHSRASSTGET